MAFAAAPSGPGGMDEATNTMGAFASAKSQ
jgi:hypothetical protein